VAKYEQKRDSKKRSNAKFAALKGLKPMKKLRAMAYSQEF
jgi:succinylarginine dihydrolase